MDFQRYEGKFYGLYEEFAGKVADILKLAIEGSSSPRPQSYQSRAKTPESLKKRLEEAGKLDSNDIENERRDLAGVRLIFYTNTDVDRFSQLGLIFDNFDVEKGATKVHQPIIENEEKRYRAIHFTVKLKEDRASLPEYKKFSGLRCEIQIQTILNHAWSETSHDILYKADRREGFGNKAMDAIEGRLNRIMDDYLLRAGYEFQRVQNDFERLQQGKELFDSGVLKAIDKAADNNERHELIRSLKDHVLPNYDDVSAIFGDLVGPLIRAAEKATTTETKPLKTPFGEAKGHSAEDIWNVILQTFERIAYADVLGAFRALTRLYRVAHGDNLKTQIVKSVHDLASYNTEVWRQVGPAIQVALADEIENWTEKDHVELRRIAIEVWTSLLSSEVSGTVWKAESAIFKRGSVPAIPQIESVREKAIKGLFQAFSDSDTDDEIRHVINALDAATHVPHSGFSNKLLARTLKDTRKIVDFYTANESKLSYEIKESLEEDFLYDYQNAKRVAEDKEDKFGAKDEAHALISAIEQFRRVFNADQRYFRYKVLVGFESVFEFDWDTDRDYETSQTFRSEQIDLFIEEIESDEQEWFSQIERCAATRSSDLATFPNFIAFLDRLSERKSDVVDRLLQRENADLILFLPALLGGLLKCADKTVYKKTIRRYVDAGVNLSGLARHWRNSKPGNTVDIKRILERAIESDDAMAVSECLLFALQGAPDDGVPPPEEFFEPAVRYLTQRADLRWLNAAWFLDKPTYFFQSASENQLKLLLLNLRPVKRLNYQNERVLGQIASRYLPLVWDFLLERINAEKSEGEGYQAVPYSFHGLQVHLASDANLAVRKARESYAADSYLFRFRGGRLLSSAFPNVVSDFATALCGLIDQGDSIDADFVLAVMANYHGEDFTHDIFKKLVEKYPNDKSKMSTIWASLWSTGVVSGEDGLANAYREKKKLAEQWLSDERENVRRFANEHIKSLDLSIADEMRRAEARREMLRLQYEDHEVSDDNGEDREKHENGNKEEDS